jgi:tetratricopeptide (TPR) repeat protein
MGRGHERTGDRGGDLLGARKLILLVLLLGIQAEPPSFRDGVALLREGRIDEAEQAFLRALTESPAHAPSSVQLARIYARSGRVTEARRTLSSALEQRPDGVVLLNELASLWIEERNAAEARPLFERVLAVDPGNARARIGIAECLVEAGDSERALASLDEARAAGVHHPAIELYRAGLLSGLGRVNESVQILKAVLAENPEAPGAQRLLGLLSYELNQDAEAAALLSRVLDRDPRDVEARVTMARILFRRSDYENARRELERALEVEAENAAAHFYLGEIEMASRRFDEAAQHYRKSTLAPARNGLAEALVKLGRYEEAERVLEEALSSPGVDRGETLYLLGSLRHDQGDDEGALEALSESSKLAPHRTETRYLMGTILARLGRGEEAQKELGLFRNLKAFEEDKARLEIVILERPDEADSYKPLIELYLANGRGAEALPFLEKALLLAPADPALLELSARVRGEAPRC